MTIIAFFSFISNPVRFSTLFPRYLIIYLFTYLLSLKFSLSSLLISSIISSYLLFLQTVIDPLNQSRLDPEYLQSQIPPELRGKLSVTDIYLQLLKNESRKNASSLETASARSAMVAIDQLRNTDSDSPGYIDDSDDSM